MSSDCSEAGSSAVPVPGEPIAFMRAESTPRWPDIAMRVSSSSFDAGAALPSRHSDYECGLSPSLAWTAITGARSYCIVMEDPDSVSVRPFVHWLAWNLSSSVTRLSEGQPKLAGLTGAHGYRQGRNSHGSIGYFGPRPPIGDALHHYHFLVLALDTRLTLPFAADRDELLAAVQGHVLARAELVGTYQQSVPPGARDH